MFKRSINDVEIGQETTLEFSPDRNDLWRFASATDALMPDPSAFAIGLVVNAVTDLLFGVVRRINSVTFSAPLPIGEEAIYLTLHVTNIHEDAAGGTVFTDFRMLAHGEELVSGEVTVFMPRSENHVPAK